MNLPGLGVVWLGLARCGFCGTAVFSRASAWFGLGLARLGLVCVWFGLVTCFSMMLLLCDGRLPLEEIPRSL